MDTRLELVWETGGVSFIYAGAVEWNKLPLSIKVESAVVFKTRIRKLLFSDLSL